MRAAIGLQEDFGSVNLRKLSKTVKTSPNGRLPRPIVLCMNEPQLSDMR
jgi:hypothetical protein